MASIKKYEEKAARASAKKRANKMQMQELASGAILGFAEGYAVKQGVAFVEDGFGPLKFSYIQAGLGYYLSTKKSGRTREVGSAMAVIGLYKIGRDLAEGFDLGGLLGGE
jgi:hypothetical protein